MTEWLVSKRTVASEVLESNVMNRVQHERQASLMSEEEYMLGRNALNLDIGGAGWFVL